MTEFAQIFASVWEPSTWWPQILTNAESLLRLLVSAALGGLIGLERQVRGRSAGFRTHLLVSLGAALVMVVSIRFADVYGNAPGMENVQVDPARVAYGVMGGIGFLGAGAILLRGHGIRGLTTAASLWCTASVGLATGFGMYVLAIFSAVLVLFALRVLGRLERRFPSRWTTRAIFVVRAGREGLLEDLQRRLDIKGVGVEVIDYTHDATHGTERVTFQLNLPNRMKVQQLRQIGRDVPDLVRFSVK
ncbi:MAG: MgtC/SapB family protein [Phycisphaerae bacterium]